MRRMGDGLWQDSAFNESKVVLSLGRILFEIADIRRVRVHQIREANPWEGLVLTDLWDGALVPRFY